MTNETTFFCASSDNAPSAVMVGLAESYILAAVGSSIFRFRERTLIAASRLSRVNKKPINVVRTNFSTVNGSALRKSSRATIPPLGNTKPSFFKSYQLFEAGFFGVEGERRDKNRRVYGAACQRRKSSLRCAHR